MWTTTILILLGILFFILLWVIFTFNRLVTLKNRVQNAWSQIDVQLQRRYDLIPNLVEAVKGYMAHERETLEAVINARNRASEQREAIQAKGGPTDYPLKELMGAEVTLTGGLGKIFALAENYPELKASQNMSQLQEELSSTENKIAFARQSYNDQVLYYNTKQQQFPTLFLAPLFGHHPAELFQVDNLKAKEAQQVSFDK